VLKEGFSEEDKYKINGGKELPFRYRWKGNA